MMENSKKLEFPEGQEGVRGNQGFPLLDYADNSIIHREPSKFITVFHQEILYGKR
jgi:hypothetical protein